MENKYVLYTTHCPRCKVIEKKLQEKNISYSIEDNEETILAAGIDTVPVLKTDNKVYNFMEIIGFLKQLEG